MTPSARLPLSPLGTKPPQEANVPLKLLLIEDTPADAELILEQLRSAGFSPDYKIVYDEQGFLSQLSPELDIILSDFRLPQFNGFLALSLLKQSGLDIPFIIVSGTIDQETAISAIKKGASDYLLKDRLGRLGTAVQRSIQEKVLRKQKQQAESGWLKSATKYLELFNSTPVGICSMTKEGRFLSANPAAVRMLGYDSEQELIASIDQIGRQIYANPSQSAEFQRQIESRGFLSSFEAQFKRKNGELIWISQSGRAIQEPPERGTSYEVFLEDITARKLSEGQLRKLSRAVEQSPVSVIITDLEGRIDYVNPKCEQVSGYSAHELIGRNPRILQGGETPQEVYQELWETISAGKEWAGDLHNRRKNGELYWEHVAISPVRNCAGETTHYLAIKEDVTEQKQLEERFLRAQRMENIGRLAGGIAHDLNNILAPIQMSIQMLRDFYEDPMTAKILDVIQSSAIRGAEIVRQVLAFGRGMEGRQIELQANNLVRELVGLMHQTFPKAIHVESSCDRNLRPMQGDPTQIHQVLLNLCVNARDAMPEGGRMEITTRNILLGEQEARALPGAKPGPYILIEVSDTGTGILPEFKSKIFDPFFTTKEIGKGTGLGLSTSFGIVQNHGGFMDFTSAPDKGTCFKVYFPAIQAPASPADQEQEIIVARGREELILVVDDEESIRAITSEMLTTYGYRCIAVSNGKEALELFQKRQGEIALVLTDLMMPVMDGATLFRALKQINPKLKIIAVSGVLLEEQNLNPSASVEIEHFLLKPFSAATLLQLLQEVLHETKEAPSL